MIAAHHSMAKVSKRSYEGTTFLLKTRDNCRTKYIGNLVIANGSESITIDWGDGDVDTYNTSVSDISHTYPATDFYVMSISDDVSSIKMRSSMLDNDNTLVAYLSFGSKITTIQSQSFQNQNIQTNDPGGANYGGITPIQLVDIVKEWTSESELVVNATSLGSYSFFPICVTLRLTNLSSFSGSWWYAGGLVPVQNLIFDSPSITIPGDYLMDWSGFMNGWNEYYEDKSVTFTNKTLSDIRSMSNFPWRATEVSIPVYFHGSDGSMDKYGNEI